jgi:hypothetical protein
VKAATRIRLFLFVFFFVFAELGFFFEKQFVWVWPPMTLGNICSLGVRRLAAFCHNDAAPHRRAAELEGATIRSEPDRETVAVSALTA